MEIDYRLPAKTARLGRDARRSNRPITHFVCELIDKFVDSELKSGTYECHNTKVECSGNSREKSLSVFLYETNLMTLCLDPKGEATHLSLSVGNRFMRHSGHPASAVVERMNGILDAIGYHGIIPAGIRLFRDAESDIFMLGDGADVRANRLLIGKDFAQSLIVDPNPHEFSVIDYEPKRKI